MTEEEKKAQQKLIYIAAQEKCLKQGLGSDPIGFSTCLAKEIQAGNDAAKTNRINDWFKSTGGVINKEIESQGGILNALDKATDIINKLRGAQYGTQGGTGTGLPGGYNFDLSRSCGEGEEFNVETGMCDKKKSKAWIWIIVAVVVILLIVGIILIIRANKKKK